MAEPTSLSPRADPLVAFFANWRPWLLGALLGTLLGWLLHLAFPPDFRARATVLADFNPEEAWALLPDRELSQLVFREADKLELLAWSDPVLEAVAAGEGVTVEELRSESLQLGHPADGGWHFYATHPSAGSAEAMASAWAEAFVEAARAAIALNPDLEAARAELTALAAAGAEFSDPEVQRLFQEIDALIEHSPGVSFYVDVYPIESEHLPAERAPSLATYLLAGSIIGALGLALLNLLGLVALPREG